jgi:hypothetical protein
MCIGLQHYTPFMDANFSHCKDERGRIFVNEYFQVTSQNPLKPKARGAELYQNVFCYGDASLSMMDEPKCIPAIKQMNPILVSNIKAAAYGGKLTSMPFAINLYAGIYCGYKGGVNVLNGLVINNKNTLKAKTDIEKTFLEYYGGLASGKSKMRNYNCQMKVLGCCGSYCCCCTGLNNRKARKARRQQLEEVIKSHKDSV